jgi:hypothetical protein
MRNNNVTTTRTEITRKVVEIDLGAPQLEPPSASATVSANAGSQPRSASGKWWALLRGDAPGLYASLCVKFVDSFIYCICILMLHLQGCNYESDWQTSRPTFQALR